VGFTNRTDVVTLASGERLVGQRDRCREDAEDRLRVMRGAVAGGRDLAGQLPVAPTGVRVLGQYELTQQLLSSNIR
jgi:hypothetical protein